MVVTVMACALSGHPGVAQAGPPRRVATDEQSPPSAPQPATSQPEPTSTPAATQPLTPPAATQASVSSTPSQSNATDLTPTGFTSLGGWTNPSIRNSTSPAIALPDRWRQGWPAWDRYGRQTKEDPILQNQAGGDSPYVRGDLLNPYDQNILKGDYPIVGDNLFLSITAVSDTLLNYRNLPTPSGPSAANSEGFDFFGDGKQLQVSQTLALSLDLFQGYTAFRPVDWLVRVTALGNANYLRLNENNGVNIDVRNGDERIDSFATLGETFVEYHLGDLSHNFDIAAVRAGRQLFVSDFRGFIFNDVTDGIRLLGNAGSNRIQYNALLAVQNQKDVNSELPELSWRDQQIFIANTYIQDAIWLGYTAQFSLHWNHDSSNPRLDDNGFPVTPDLAGSAQQHDIDAVYLGWAGDGHIDRLNISHALYYVTGHDTDNPIAGRSVDLGAFMGAIELSVDIDWLRPKLSFLYASGDGNPTDSHAGGFDGIVDNPSFAGGASSYYQNQAIRLLGVNLVSAKSFYNDLAATKGQGQSNYVNPGSILLGAGLDVEITPKLRASVNANSLWFADTASLEYFLNQNSVSNYIGQEFDLSIQYRPWLNNNIIFTAGTSMFLPGRGFVDIYESSHPLFQLFTGVTLTY
jgi:hypothetical protein